MNFDRKQVLLLDYQHHVGNDKQIFIKELVFMRADCITPTVLHFKPPYPWNELDKQTQKHVKFCESHINKLLWSSGDRDYTELSFIIKELANDESIKTVLVKGEDKVKFLRTYLDKVEEIPMPKSFLNYPSYQHTCKLHDPHFHRCSINHVFQMFMFLNQQE